MPPTSVRRCGVTLGSHRANFWKPVEANLRQPRIQCTLCPRKCILKDGQRGFCYIRQNQGGEMHLTSYGRSSGFAIDPIEKKPLNHFLPGSNILSFGTAGCNMGCKFCQNWDISKSKCDDRLQSTDIYPTGIAKASRDSGCASVAVTYNDPVIFYEYAIDTAEACRKMGVKSVAVTAGYVSDEARESFFDAFDATNVDLKAFNEDFYKQVCNAKLQPVLDTLAHVAQKGKTWLEVTTLVIPGQNDSVEEMEKQCKWLVEHCGWHVPLHLTAFHPDYKMDTTPQTPLETLLRLRDVALRCGLKFVYTGNVHHPETATTFCHSCGCELIARDWHMILSYRVTKDGRCAKCDAKVPGVFDKAPKMKLYERRGPRRVDMSYYRGEEGNGTATSTMFGKDFFNRLAGRM